MRLAQTEFVFFWLCLFCGTCCTYRSSLNTRRFLGSVCISGSLILPDKLCGVDVDPQQHKHVVSFVPCIHTQNSHSTLNTIPATRFGSCYFCRWPACFCGRFAAVLPPFQAQAGRQASRQGAGCCSRVLILRRVRVSLFVVLFPVSCSWAV
ncbi:hypothetical protein DFH11DRAFT_853712 [Phellopilus nigrolimitatus]|nr:hypothetical protein DFH11DRAFT_853712 [Phellopilus nigrolimitatus]